MPDSPRVVIQLNARGQVVASASNISRELDIVYTNEGPDFANAALSLPFNSTVEPQPVQVLSAAARE